MVAIAARCRGRRRPALSHAHRSARHFHPHLSDCCLDRIAHRPLEARPMKHMRITAAHQSITFSRRMMLFSGAQAAIGGLLIGRMGYLSITQNEKYQLLSESNRVQLIPVPPRRGWIVDRKGKPIAINRSSFRVDLIPQQLSDRPRVVSEVASLLKLPQDEVERINR